MWVSHHRQGLCLSKALSETGREPEKRRLSDKRSRVNIAAQHTFIMQIRYIVLSLHRWAIPGGAVKREKLMYQLFELLNTTLH